MVFSSLSLITGGVAVLPLGLGIALRNSLPLPLTLVLYQTAASGFAVALAATDLLASRSTRLLGKDPRTGQISAWGLALFYPYHLSLRAVLALKRLKNRKAEPLWTHVKDGWYIGGWPPSHSCLPLPDMAVIDVTCELPRQRMRTAAPRPGPPHLPATCNSPLGKTGDGDVAAPGGPPAELAVSAESASGGAYLNLPVWDSMAPTQQQISAAVGWALAQREAGRRVLVHCAHGHGRSCVVLCALLVAAGAAPDHRRAFEMVQAARPRVRLNEHQLPGLRAWEAEHALLKKRGNSGGRADASAPAAGGAAR